jgi:hypothetical protein
VMGEGPGLQAARVIDCTGDNVSLAMYHVV